MNHRVSSSRTISSQKAYASQIHLTNSTLSFQEVLKIGESEAIKINQFSVYNSYRYHIKNLAIKVIFNESDARKYQFRPKTLADILYGNIEFYTLIFRMNNIHSVSDFTFERLKKGIYVPSKSIIGFLDEVLIKEKIPINRNLSEVSKDVNSLD